MVCIVVNHTGNSFKGFAVFTQNIDGDTISIYTLVNLYVDCLSRTPIKRNKDDYKTLPLKSKCLFYNPRRNGGWSF